MKHKLVTGHSGHQNTGLSRRGFLRRSVLAGLAPLGLGHLRGADGASGGESVPNAIAPAVALRRLLDGNSRYAANRPTQQDFSVGRMSRVAGQHPIAAVLSCADARLAPEHVFDQGPGELFVMRVAGNVVSPDLLASLEYGVKYLGIPLVMVLGHSNCGAVAATIKVLEEDITLPGHLPELADSIKPAIAAAKKQHGGELLERAVAENVRQQVALLKQSGPIVSEFYAEQTIDIVGGVYDLATGKVTPI